MNGFRQTFPSRSTDEVTIFEQLCDHPAQGPRDHAGGRPDRIPALDRRQDRPAGADCLQTFSIATCSM